MSKYQVYYHTACKTLQNGNSAVVLTTAVIDRSTTAVINQSTLEALNLNLRLSTFSL